MNKKQWDTIWINACVATCEKDSELITHGAVAIKDSQISWVGAMNELSSPISSLAKNVYDVSGHCITPGLIDCHTHLIYAGNRALEFEQRLKGATYEEISQQGGGIQSTVMATRAATEKCLLQQSLIRAKSLLASGVTTIEIKSGYGLEWPTEKKMLRVAKSIEDILPLTVMKTFLGAHTVPKEYISNADGYIDVICKQMVPLVAQEKLADAVDVFCEKIAFTLSQTERVFKAAQEHHLKIKCHAEQLSDSGGAKLAVEWGALSVDHLEYISLEAIKTLAGSRTVAVLLPGAFYFLREKKLPPIEWLREFNIPIALASDCNPGTSPIMSLPLILNLACTLFGMTPEEALHGVTRCAAQALGLENDRGTLTTGKIADLAVWKASHPVELAYYMGGNPLHQLIKGGKWVIGNGASL